MHLHAFHSLVSVTDTGDKTGSHGYVTGTGGQRNPIDNPQPDKEDVSRNRRRVGGSSCFSVKITIRTKEQLDGMTTEDDEECGQSEWMRMKA